MMIINPILSPLLFQSLVDRLHLNAEDITIQPVHPSIIGQDTWFQITYTSSGTTRYFSCQNPKERDEWIQSLKKTLTLTEDRRRTDNCLKLGVFEVKGLRDKKKYYVEIFIDDKLYARTSSKKMAGMCFWGEHFTFRDLPKTERLSLLIYKDKGNRKKSKKPVGRVRIGIPSIQSRYMQEKWHQVEKSARRESPSIRLKCQFQSVDILPLRDYEDFLYFLKDEYKAVCKLFEPNISVKVKEELSHSLMSVFHSEEMAEDVLAEIVVDEISSVENEHLTFRGNSIATKAMEAYMKLVGQRYLQSTLHSVVTEIILSEVDLEIDLNKVGNNPEALLTHRANLRTVVKQVWSRISMSYSYFPIQLQRCFYKIRQYLEHVGKPEVGDNLISSCIFLRYLCPAVLSPSLFNLTDEYPSEKANRNLTLIAKTLQTLANFTKYEGKENSMEFLNSFLEEEAQPMRNFLKQISSPLAEDGWIPNLATPLEKTDLGYHLSCLHTVLFENISKVPADNPKSVRLRELLDEINSILHRPTIAGLEQISQPTMTTLKQRQVDGTTPTSPATTTTTTTKTSSILPWSWTLPKKSKSGGANFSHPAPHHEINPGRNFFAKPEPGISMSSDTSSSTSLTPSPCSQGKASSGVSSRHHHATDLPSRKSKRFPSSMSLDDTDSSDDSTYSSQYQSDATSTPRCHSSHTLPRPITGGGNGYATQVRHNTVQRGGAAKSSANKSLSDYESEIMELRSAMETLQVKLGEAERKLQEKQGISATQEESVREIMRRLASEEDQLRRDQAANLNGDSSDKEMMILMQQRKIASLDEANGRLVEELNKLGEKMTQKTITKLPGVPANTSSPSSEDSNTPRTVDELIDSLHSTPI